MNTSEQQNRFTKYTSQLYPILDTCIEEAREQFAQKGFTLSTAGQRFTGERTLRTGDFSDRKRLEHVVVVRHTAGTPGVTAIVHLDDFLFFLAHRKVWEEFKEECEKKGFCFDESELLRAMENPLGGIPAKYWVILYDPPFAQEKQFLWRRRPCFNEEYCFSRDHYATHGVFGDAVYHEYKRICLAIAQNGGPIAKGCPSLKNEYAKPEIAFFAPSPLLPTYDDRELNSLPTSLVAVFFEQAIRKLLAASKTDPPEMIGKFSCQYRAIPLVALESVQRVLKKKKKKTK